MTRQAALLFIARAAPHACLKNQPAKWLCSLSAKALMTQAFHGGVRGCLRLLVAEPPPGSRGPPVRALTATIQPQTGTSTMGCSQLAPSCCLGQSLPDQIHLHMPQVTFIFPFFPPFYFGSYVNPSFPSVGIAPCNYEAAGSLLLLNWSCCFPAALFLVNYAVFGQLPSILTDWLPKLTDSTAWAALIPHYLWKWCCVAPCG